MKTSVSVRRPWLLLCGLGLACLSVQAHDKDAGPQVVPDAERVLAPGQNLAGPAQNRGIRSVTPIGAVVLDGEIAEVRGRQMRARELVIEPGGVVAVHRHDARPGVAYILEGEIVEHRSDQPQPLLRKQGDAAFEKTGLTHWWENRTQKPVRALVIDIVPSEIQ